MEKSPTFLYLGANWIVLTGGLALSEQHAPSRGLMTKAS